MKPNGCNDDWDHLRAGVQAVQVNCQDITLRPCTRWGRGISVPSSTDWSALNLVQEDFLIPRVKKMKKESAGSLEQLKSSMINVSRR